MRYIVSKTATLPWLESFAARMAPGPLALRSVRRHMHRVQAFQAAGLSHLHGGRFKSVPRYAGCDRPSEQAAPTSADFRRFAPSAHVASPRRSRASSPIRRWRTVSALVLNSTLVRPGVSLCVRSTPIGRETFTSLSATVTRFIPIADLAGLNEKVLADVTVLSERIRHHSQGASLGVWASQGQ